MPKTANCETCLYHAQDFHLVCAVHPNGHDNDFCPDFQANPDLEVRKFVDFLGLLQVESDAEGGSLRDYRNCNEPFDNPLGLDPDEELWKPEGATYYNGELILQRVQRTREEQLWLLDNHPRFTGVCPRCLHHFPQANFHIVHFDCSNCGWVDNSV